MEDSEILLLLASRDERGLRALRDKYAALCRKIAMQHLRNTEDAEEIMNDVLLEAWNAIPPAEPENLGGFLSVLTKRAAVSRYRQTHAEKRGGGETPAVLEELAECIPAAQDVEAHVEERQLTAALNRFLASLPAEMRAVTVQRYVRQLSVAEIAVQYGISESKVKSMLFRARKRLRKFLDQEEWI